MANWFMIQLLRLLQDHPLLITALAVFLIAAQWKLFAKAGQPGWAVLVPIYGQIVHARIAGLPWWVGLALFAPVINLLALLAISFGTAKRFGRGPLFGLGLAFASPIFTPVLAFGGSRYRLYG
jgi:hypothetical protein